MTEIASTARLPPNYRIVYDVVRAQAPGAHASAADIFLRAKTIKASLGFSTIYRALGRLCGLGLVLELHVPGHGAVLYEPARGSHAHFVCAGCGRIEDVECAVPDRAIRAAVGTRGGVVDGIVLTVNGRCAACIGRHSDLDS